MPANESDNGNGIVLREIVAAQLEKFCSPGGELHMDSESATWRAHSITKTDPYSALYSAARVRVHKRLIDEFIASHEEIATDGYAVVTAGPPAVGKSTRLNMEGYDSTWRRIDPDYFKARLIEHDLRTGLVSVPPSLANGSLADGQALMPLELSGLYHRESAVLANKAQYVCMGLRENIIIEGTLSWKDLVEATLDDLKSNDYRRLDVLIVGAPLQVVLEQSLKRWWSARSEGSGLGGRFTPASVIKSMYLNDSDTICAPHAELLDSKATLSGLRSKLIR